MIRTIRTTVRNLRTDDVIVPMRGDGHGLTGRVTHVHVYGVAVNGVATFTDVWTDKTRAYGLAPNLAISVRRTATAQIAARHTLNNKGGTFDPYTLDPQRHAFGYMVGIGSRGNGTLAMINTTWGFDTTSLLAYAIAQIANVARTVERAYVGTWIDNGIAYVEVSVWVENKSEAIELATAHNQRAIWDVRNSAQIDLTYCECSDPFTARMTGHGHACPLYTN